MRKQILLTVLALLGCCTAAWADVQINEANFPDATFRNWVLSQEYGKDGVLTDAEIGGVTSISVPYMNIQSLQGIEYFTALKSLICRGNQLTKLDVSKHTALKYLSCSENRLTVLDVSKNTALKYLSCGENRLTALDVSKNTALTYLSCYSNQLTALDVSKNTALTELSCHSNQLTTLDLTKNTALTSLWCYSNQIKGAAMDALVESLPKVREVWYGGEMRVIYFENEGNVMTTVQVKAAKKKGWRPQYTDGSLDERENPIWKEYKGSSQ